MLTGKMHLTNYSYTNNCNLIHSVTFFFFLPAREYFWNITCQLMQCVEFSSITAAHIKLVEEILSPNAFSPSFRKWVGGKGCKRRITLFWLFLCFRQKLYLHATKAIALFKEECVSKYDKFLDKSEDWTRQVYWFL